MKGAKSHRDPCRGGAPAKRAVGAAGMAGTGGGRKPGEQKEFLMSSAYRSRPQNDVQLPNLYLNHGCLMSLKDDLDK